MKRCPKKKQQFSHQRKKKEDNMPENNKCLSK